eukprot:jgi/Ulvmu1/10376/UM061_0059.1
MGLSDPLADAISVHGRFDAGALIGKGSYGSVYEGVDTKNGNKIALKVIDLDELEDDISEVMQEITALANCDCPQITKYYDSMLLPDSSKLVIAMELMSCSGADLLELAPWPEAGIAYAMKQVLQALDYLHSQRRMHRDIKAANVLLSAEGVVKVADFGVSGQLTATLGYKRRTFVGTPYWMAPEAIESSEEGYTCSADIWSLGITAIEMAQQRPPHSELHPMRVLFVIPKAEQPVLAGGQHSAHFKDFVALCTAKDPQQRPSASALLAHPFLKAQEKPPAELLGLLKQAEAKRAAVAPTRSAATLSRRTTAQRTESSGPFWDFPDDDRGSGMHGRPAVGEPEAPPGSEQGTVRLQRLPPSSWQDTGDGTVRIMRPDSRISGGGGGGGEGPQFRTVTAADMAAYADESDVPLITAAAAKSNARMQQAPLRPPSLRAPSTRDASEGFAPVDTATILNQASTPATLKHVIGPALTAAGRPAEGAMPAAQAVGDAVDAFARLEAASPGACLAFVAQVMSEAVAAPIAGGGELVQLRKFATRMAAAVQSAPDEPEEEKPPMLEFLKQRWRSNLARDELRAAGLAGSIGS